MSLKFSNTHKKLIAPENQIVQPSILWNSMTGSRGPQGESITGPQGESITGPTGPQGESITGPQGEGITGPIGGYGPTGPSITGPTGPSGNLDQVWKLGGNEVIDGEYLGSLNKEPLILGSNGNKRIFIHPDGSLQLFGSRSPLIKEMIQLPLNIKQIIVQANSTTLINATEFSGSSVNSLAQLFPLQPLPPGVGIGYMRFFQSQNSSSGSITLEISFINCSSIDQIVDGTFNLFVTNFSQ